MIENRSPPVASAAACAMTCRLPSVLSVRRFRLADVMASTPQALVSPIIFAECKIRNKHIFRACIFRCSRLSLFVNRNIFGLQWFLTGGMIRRLCTASCIIPTRRKCDDQANKQDHRYGFSVYRQSKFSSFHRPSTHLFKVSLSTPFMSFASMTSAPDT